MSIHAPKPSPLHSKLLRYAQKMQFDRAGVVSALRTFVTAWAAFAIASLLHVENAYWAGMAAWIVQWSSSASTPVLGGSGNEFRESGYRKTRKIGKNPLIDTTDDGRALSVGP